MKVGYAGAHQRLRRKKGSAKGFACVDCGKPAREWSYDHRDPRALVAKVRGRRLIYSLDPEHYDPRCPRCHQHRDSDRRSAAQAIHAPYPPGCQLDLFTPRRYPSPAPRQRIAA